MGRIRLRAPALCTLFFPSLKIFSRASDRKLQVQKTWGFEVLRPLNYWFLVVGAICGFDTKRCSCIIGLVKSVSLGWLLLFGFSLLTAWPMVLVIAASCAFGA